jgi:two-component system chemotaxis response regulator CheY
LAEPAAVIAPPPHILIVDDATVVRLYYRQLLEVAGYRVDEAINGIEGLEKALQTPYDLCIVDVNMPFMDGYAFINALRSNAQTRNMRTIITTTEASEEDRALGHAAGANGYLVKPVNREEFTAHVAAQLAAIPAATM